LPFTRDAADSFLELSTDQNYLGHRWRSPQARCSWPPPTTSAGAPWSTPWGPRA